VKKGIKAFANLLEFGWMDSKIPTDVNPTDLLEIPQNLRIG